jgi:hypothetical protein
MNYNLTTLIAVFCIVCIGALLPVMLGICVSVKTSDLATLRKKGPKVREEIKLSNGKTLRIFTF